MGARRCRAGKGLTALEVRGARVAYCMGMQGSKSADIYWLPDERNLTFRDTVTKGRRKPNAVPAGAIFLGRYTRETGPVQFADDLDDFLGGLEAQKAAA